MSPERSIDLAPADRFVVTWEKHAPLDKPEPPEFDLDRRIDHLCAVGARSGHDFDWRAADVPAHPSPVEALFWVLAYELCDGLREVNVVFEKWETDLCKEFETALELGMDQESMSAGELLKAYHHPSEAPQNLVCCAAALLDAENFATFVRTTLGAREAAPAFRQHVAPFLSGPRREAIRRKIVGSPVPNKFSGWTLDIPPFYYLGAYLGCHEEMAAILKAMPDGQLGRDRGHFHAEWIVFGLADRESVIAEARRLQLVLHTPAAVHAWLALTGFDALDVIADSVCAITRKADAAVLAEPIARVKAPEMALPALSIATESKAPRVGHEWLKAHPVEAIVGLAPIASGAGVHSKAAASCFDLSEENVAAAIPHLSAEVADWLRREADAAAGAEFEEMPLEDLHSALREVLCSAKRSAIPIWLNLSSLPPIEVGDKVLAKDEIVSILALLNRSPLGSHSTPLRGLRAYATPASLDRFAWRLASAWLNFGAPSKDKWAMGAVGHIGGPVCTAELAPLIREWPGISQHKRAVFGLECLRAIGSETALMALNGIALDTKFRALKRKAQAMMAEIADDLGMTHEALADRIVPDCGLDEHGCRAFDFGPRQFEFVLGPGVKPMLRDAAGKLRPVLPKPNKSDDPALVEAAKAEWAALKKELKATLKVQAARLEDAMVNRRRWTPVDFDNFLVNHPLMIHLARGLVFAAGGGGGKVGRTFRITEDHAFSDQYDAPLAIEESCSVWIVHPLELDAATRNAWGELLSDYEIISPFPQIGRSTYGADPGELEQTEIARFKDVQVPAVAIYGTLERRPWIRGAAGDGGGFSEHFKRFPALETTAFISYDGIAPPSNFDELREIKSIYFLRDSAGGKPRGRLKIREVDPIILSETLLVAHAIVAHATT